MNSFWYAADNAGQMLLNESPKLDIWCVSQPLNDFEQANNKGLGSSLELLASIALILKNRAANCPIATTMVREFGSVLRLPLCSHPAGGGFWNRKHRLDPCFLHCALFMFQRLPAFLCHFSGLRTALPADGYIMIYWPWRSAYMCVGTATWSEGNRRCSIPGSQGL